MGEWLIYEVITDADGVDCYIKRGKVVRCKNCRHRDPEDKKCDCGHEIMWQLPRADEWFCADGEAKERASDDSRHGKNQM